MTVFLVRVVAPVWRSGFPRVFPDTWSFAAVADRGPLWPRFWFDERPVGMPLVLWAVGRSDRLFVLVQATAYAAACVVLCAVLWRVVRHRMVAGLASLVVVALACQPRVAQWTTVVLSESLGLTGAMASSAAWVLFGAAPSRRRLWCAVGVSLVWMLVRDSHVLPLALVLIPALLVGAGWWRSAPDGMRRSLLHAAVLTSSVCVYVTVSQDVSDRNRYPVMNNVGQRILPDPGLAEWFTDRGLPVDEVLLGRTGRSAFDDGSAMLTDPRLQTFREWADGPGQRLQLWSFVRRADAWTSRLSADLPQILATDLAEYDLQGVQQRLPGRLAWIDGPRTSGQLAVWTLIALCATAVLALVARRRLLALVVALALVSAWLELYLAYAGDSLEVTRHLVGPVFRLTLVMVVAVALGVDALAGRRVEPRPIRPIARRDVGHAALVSLGTAVVLAAFFGNEFRSQDYDPQFARTVVERAATVGGTYYENGIHNKGPLEMVVYDASRWITGWGSYWFGISGVVLLLAGTVGAAAGLTSRRLGAHRLASLAVAAGVTVHFALSTSDYAGVVYSRNLTSCLLALVMALAVSDRPWKREVSWVVCGVFLGLAVQTLLTTALAALVVGGFVVAYRGGERRLRRSAVLAGSAAVTVFMAPLWYVVRGAGDEFWAGWWTYARYMSEATGRSLADQIGLGWVRLLGHLHERPEVLALVVAFALVTWGGWRAMDRRTRCVHVAVGAWFAAAWIELVVSQRYSSHYFSVEAVPLAVMAGALVAAVCRWSPAPGAVPASLLALRSSTLAPLGVTVTVILLQCAAPFWDGLGVAGRFTGFADHAASREASLNGPERSARAVLDLVGDDDDPVLAWTMYPWTYLNQRRVPATRFSWKSFLLGEIYLARTDSSYVLPRTWEWFAEDLAETRPTALLTVTETPIVEDTPFAAVANSYVPVYPGPRIQVAVRPDLAASLTGPVVDGEPWLPFADVAPGWRWGEDGLRSTGAPGSEPVEILPSGCARLAARVDVRAGPVVFRLRHLDDSAPDVVLGFDGRRAWSGDDQAEYESVEQGTRRSALVLVVGARSAALVVDGMIGAAVRLAGDVSVSVDTVAADVVLSGLSVGAAPPESGC